MCISLTPPCKITRSAAVFLEILHDPCGHLGFARFTESGMATYTIARAETAWGRRAIQVIDDIQKPSRYDAVVEAIKKREGLGQTWAVMRAYLAGFAAFIHGDAGDRDECLAISRMPNTDLTDLPKRCSRRRAHRPDIDCHHVQRYMNDTLASGAQLILQ